VVARDVEGQQDHTGGLGGVLEAVAEGHRSRGRGLGQTEAARDPARVGVAEDPEDRRHEEVAADETDDRRGDHRDDDLLPDDGPLDGDARDEGRAAEAADERV
jgi:hypothetical protein